MNDKTLLVCSPSSKGTTIAHCGHKVSPSRRAMEAITSPDESEDWTIMCTPCSIKYALEVVEYDPTDGTPHRPEHN